MTTEAMTTDTLEHIAPETQAPATELTVIERADLALDAGATEKHLRELVAKSASITEIKDRTGREQCHRAAMELADARIAIQKTGKTAREDATKFSKAVIAREKELVEIVSPEEVRLLAVRDTWDAVIEAEKAAAAAAEQARVTGIQKRIEEIRSFADLAVQARTSATVEKLGEKLAAIAADESFEEFADQAVATKAQVMARVDEIFAAKKAEEDERARIKAEQDAAAAKLAADRAELERQQAEAAAAQAKAAADLKAAQEAQAKADREAAQARAAAEAEAQAKRDAEAAELQRQRDAFAAEQAAARAAQQAEADRLQAQADDLARQRAELEPKPVLPSAEWSPAAMETSMEKVVAMLEDDSVTAIPATLLVEAAAELDAQPMPVTMAAPKPADPSDAEIICTAANAVADAYGWTFGQAVQRLGALEWTQD